MKSYFKKGAMFGLDARITLAVTAIAAFIVGINQFTEVDRQNNNQTELEMKVIQKAIQASYKDNYQIPLNTSQLIDKSYLHLENGDLDPWGNAYVIAYEQEEVIIKQSKMQVKYVYILSFGKDAIRQTATTTNVASFRSLQAAGDDVLLKFDTMSIEQDIADTEDKQLIIVKNLLESYVMSKQSENSTNCADKSYQNSYLCDINEDGIYDLNEELFLNYMPKDIDDDNAKYYLTINSTYGTENKFKSGYINTSVNYQYNMYTFMQLINGVSEYVISPRGLVLHFKSNKYNNTKAPYYAEIWYDEEQTVF